MSGVLVDPSPDCISRKSIAGSVCVGWAKARLRAVPTIVRSVHQWGPRHPTGSNRFAHATYLRKRTQLLSYFRSDLLPGTTECSEFEKYPVKLGCTLGPATG